MAKFRTLTRYIVAALIPNYAPAYAASLDFDCDVPADHYSSVTQDLGQSPSISGTVRLIKMRSGDHLPAASVWINETGGKPAVGFQLVAAASQDKSLEIILINTKNDKFQNNIIGQISSAASISFNLSLSDSGKAIILIDGTQFQTDFVPLRNARVMVSCSTAQFKFSDLSFSDGSASARETGKSTAADK